MPTWQVILLGLIEGLTEYIPVSSTGHLLLVEHLLGFTSPGRTFEVLIQLGAILALLTVYAAKLWELARALPNDPRPLRWPSRSRRRTRSASKQNIAFNEVVNDIQCVAPWAKNAG